jgi:hypothetical protein
MNAHGKKPRHLHVLIPGEYSRPQSLSESNLASIRMRSALAASCLCATGWKASIGEVVSSDPDVILVGKIGANDIAQRTSGWIRKLQKAKGKRCKVLVDYTDNHLEFDSPMRPFYSAALELADHFIVPGIFLAQRLAHRSEKPIALIPDPIEVPVIPVKSGKPNSPIRALWFGHRTNISYLVDFIERQLTSEHTLEIIVLSDEFALSALRSHQFRTAARVTLSLVPWSIKNLISSSQISDICIIPSDPNDPKKAGASSNRLVTALALGLPTAVDLLPSYVDFSDFVVEIQSRAFGELLRAPEIMNDKTTVAQHEVIPNFTPSTIGQQWVDLLDSII